MRKSLEAPHVINVVVPRSSRARQSVPIWVCLGRGARQMRADSRDLVSDGVVETLRLVVTIGLGRAGDVQGAWRGSQALRIGP